jgi:putative nucleotidyltransferase with HDIG domain
MKHLSEIQVAGLQIPEFANAFVRKMMMELKAYDAETYEHCVRVSRMCMRTATELKLSPLEVAIATYSGLLHDLGKIKVPTNILNKPDRLTAEEFDIMKKHTQFGVDLIAPLVGVDFFKQVSQAVLYHHERVDGNGYFGIKSEEIPYCAKIILVVDTVDAMTQDRAYRKGRSFDVACEELIRCSGTQFEPVVVDAFLEAYSGANKVAIAA